MNKIASLLLSIILLCLLEIYDDNDIIMTNKEIRASYNLGMSDTNEYTKIKYDLMTTIVYASIDIKADGSILKPSRYDPVPLIKYAHDRGVKVVLMFTTDIDTDIILGDSTVRTIAINNLLNEVVTNNFDGICNNIENVNRINTVTNTPNRDLMTMFQKELAEIFWARNSNYDISVWIGYTNWNDIWDVVALNNYTNYFQIMAYGFGRGSTGVTNAGSYTPINDSLQFETQGIYRSLVYWYGLGLDKNKTLLGITYEGYEWPSVDNTRLSKTTGLGVSIKYDIIMPNIGLYQRIFDDEWKTPYFVRQVNGQWYQAHIDDVQSLRIKYDLVNSEKLAGITIWTIDEGTDRTELWQVIKEKFYYRSSSWREKDATGAIKG